MMLTRLACRLVPLLSAVIELAAATPVAGQVTAKQAPTPVSLDQEICPLQLDFDLSPHLAKLREAPPGRAVVSAPTSTYVCDKARVENITVRKATDRPREVLLEVSAMLSSKWMRQDVNLTVSLLVNGQVVKSEQFRSLTIGDPNANWAARNVSFAGSSSKERGLRFWIKRAQFNEWFGPASKPVVRVVMEVVDHEEEEEAEEEEG